VSDSAGTEASVRLESALEIVGALKDRFGEALTVAEICRTVPLSYQPVYSYVRRLASDEALSAVKRGQRLLCEPAATPAGSLWLAQRSWQEVCRARLPLLEELVAALRSRMVAAAASGVVAALDPDAGEGGLLYVTDGTLGEIARSAPVRVVSRTQLADLLVGRTGRCEVARRILPLCGEQQMWSLALSARDSVRAAGNGTPPRRPARRRAFID
jgi:hypothetical protein